MWSLCHRRLKFGGGTGEVALLEGLRADLEVMPAARGRVLIGASRRRLGRGQTGREQQRRHQLAHESTPDLHSEISNTGRAAGGAPRSERIATNHAGWRRL